MTSAPPDADSMDLPQNAARDFRRTLSRPALVPLAGMGVLALCFLLLIGLLWWSGRQTERTERVVTQLSLIERLMVDMETGLRGYQLRGERLFLEPYLRAQPRVEPALAELRSLVKEKGQVRRAAAVTPLVESWLAWAEPVRQSAEAGAATTLEQGTEGKRRMDAVRASLDEMNGAEYDLRDGKRQRTWAMVTAAVVLSLLLSAGLGFVLARRYRKTLRDTAATYTQVIRTNRKQERQLEDALDRLDHEMKAVARIQEALLPKEVPNIYGLELAAHYSPSSRVGGDYYDFFPLAHAPLDEGEPENDPGERWGILIADVSGHGTPAAVMMAVTHTIAHGYEEPPMPASHLLDFVNRRLCKGYTGSAGVAFVTAFYAIYSPDTRVLQYSSAGHNPPRVRRASTGQVEALTGGAGLPMGIDDSEDYPDAETTLEKGDVLILYTDGITESRNNANGFFEEERLDAAVGGAEGTPQQIIDRTLAAVKSHAAGREADDDQTLIVARVY